MLGIYRKKNNILFPDYDEFDPRKSSVNHQHHMNAKVFEEVEDVENPMLAENSSSNELITEPKKSAVK
jgi:hypothetical protein